MGVVHPGVPKTLALFLRDTAHIKTFVETGTYLGDTAAWASEQFEHVITIEASEALAEGARTKWAHLANVQFLTGESSEQLSSLVPKLDSPTLFWLDAHWSAGNTYGKEQECPLLEEIGALHKSRSLNILLIDDARLFLSPPPPPHKIAAWPNITDVIGALREAIPDAYIVIIEDVIITVPESLKPALSEYSQGLSAEHEEARLRALRRKHPVATLKSAVKRLVR